MSENETLSAEQVVFVGLDGVGFGEIADWLAAGDLPNLAGLIDGGKAGDLRSTTPPWTPVAWPSMMTGRNPGKHGAFGFFARDGYEKSLLDRSDVQSPYLWEVLSAEELTPLVINVPVTNPATDLERGALVPGYLAPEDASFSPEGLREEYEREYGTYRIYPDYGEDATPSEYISVARHRRNMARFLDERYDWDLLAVQFQVTDSVFHDLDDDEARREVYCGVDEFVGNIVSLADDPAVVVASDHGMGDYDGVFYINSWLAEHGYCETTTGDVTYFRDVKSELHDGDGGDDGGSLSMRALSAAARMGLTQRRAHAVLDTMGLASVVSRLLPEDAHRATRTEQVDWERSTAFQALFNSWGVHLNREGREPAGTVATDEYEAVREELIEELSAIASPDGGRLFERVRPCEEIYDGDCLDAAPDIVVEPRDCRYDVSGTILEPFRTWEHKNHKREGIVAVDGPEVASGELVDAAIYDVAPTIAALLNVPLDDRSDGSPLVDFGSDEATVDWDEIASAQIDASVDEATADESNVEDRLRNLGYME